MSKHEALNQHRQNSSPNLEQQLAQCDERCVCQVCTCGKSYPIKASIDARSLLFLSALKQLTTISISLIPCKLRQVPLDAPINSMTLITTPIF